MMDFYFMLSFEKMVEQILKYMFFLEKGLFLFFLFFFSLLSLFLSLFLSFFAETLK